MWHAFEDGATIGQQGSESGEIAREEEHPLGARITLERNTSIAPFAITCGIYGWMVHTRFFESEEEATSAYEMMKARLAEIIEPFENPDYDDRRATEQAIEAFVEAYP